MRARQHRRRAGEEPDQRRLGVEVGPRRAPGDAAEEARLELGAVERDRGVPGEQHDVALLPPGGNLPHVLDRADAADDRSRVDRAPVGLVVERHVPGDDGDAERLAGERHALDRLGQLPGHVGLLGVAEVQAVRDRERRAAGAGDVARRLEHGVHPGGARIERRRAAGAVQRNREPAHRRAQPEHRGVQSGAPNGARPDEVVVALEDAAAAADVRRAEQLEEVERLGLRGRDLHRRGGLARLGLELVARRLVREEPRRDLADRLAVEEAAQLARLGHLADHGAGELPALAQLLDLGEPLGLDHGDHPLLALGDHDLDRIHRGLALGHAIEMNVDPGSSARGHLGQRRGEPCSAEILERHAEPVLDERERELDQLLAGERIADLHGRPLVLVRVGELLAREHARAADAVPAGRRAVEDDQVPGPTRAGGEDALRRQHPDAHRVHERVRRVDSSNTASPPTVGTPTQFP